jgi:hypothetical protein
VSLFYTFFFALTRSVILFYFFASFARVALQQPSLWPRPAESPSQVLTPLLETASRVSDATLDALVLSLQIADPGDLEAVRAGVDFLVWRSFSGPLICPLHTGRCSCPSCTNGMRRRPGPLTSPSAPFFWRLLFYYQ